MRHLDLFSGIGGFALAASWVWGDEHEIVGFCEIDSFCQKVLKKHWPNVPIYPDIKELKGDQFNAVELVTGGFPCQPYSVAGKQQGKEDDRHLWPEMFRIIREARPHWVIAENVPGIVNMELDQVLFDLESEDYTWETFIIPACAINAPHKRNRVWVVAYSISPENTPKHIQSFRYCKQKRRGIKIWGKVTRQSNGETDTDGTSGCGKTVADNNQINGNISGFHTGAIPQQPEARISINNVADSQEPGLSNGRQSGIKTGQDEENGGMAFTGFERCGGSWWAVEPAVGGAFDGFSAWLDRNIKLLFYSHKSLLNYGHEKEKRTSEIMQTLWSGISAKTLQWEIGGFISIQETEILFSYLRKLKETSETLDNMALQSAEAQKKILRSVWFKDEFAMSSYRSESTEQSTGEHSNSLQALSRLLAYHAKESWLAYCRENALPISQFWQGNYEMNIPRVANGIPDRVDRLKALGNAIVPQLAAVIMQGIKEVDSAF